MHLETHALKRNPTGDKILAHRENRVRFHVDRFVVVGMNGGKLRTVFSYPLVTLPADVGTIGTVRSRSNALA